MLAQQGISTETAATVTVASLAGVASSGYPLAQVISTTRDLSTLVATMVSDAGRQAQMLATTAHTGATGYVRMLNPPSCDRCIILAGKKFTSNGGVHYHQVDGTWVKERVGTGGGFERHPNCDCICIPTNEAMAGDITLDPDAYFHSLTEDEQNAVFGKANAEAVRLGADLSQIVNARRGAQRAQVFGRQAWTTLSGVTKYGTFGKRRTQLAAQGRNMPVRLMPETLLRIAGDDRAKALELLWMYGYIL